MPAGRRRGDRWHSRVMHCTAPVAGATPRAARTAAPSPVRRRVRMPFVRPTALLVAASALVAGAVTQATVNQIHADNARHAEVLAAEAHEAIERGVVAHHLRMDAASTARLSAQATAYLASRRTEARRLAQGAIETAGQLTAAGTDVLAPGRPDCPRRGGDRPHVPAGRHADAQAALGDAVAKAGTAPVVPAVKDIVALPVVSIPVVPTVDLLPVTPLGDALELVGGDPAGADHTTSAVDTAPEAALASVSEPVGTDTATGRKQTPAAATGDAAAAAVLATADLDLGASERLTEVARTVMELSVRVQATLDAQSSRSGAAGDSGGGGRRSPGRIPGPCRGRVAQRCDPREVPVPRGLQLHRPPALRRRARPGVASTARTASRRVTTSPW